VISLRLKKATVSWDAIKKNKLLSSFLDDEAEA